MSTVENLREKVSNYSEIMQLVSALEECLVSNRSWMLQINRWDKVVQFRVSPNPNPEVARLAKLLKGFLSDVRNSGEIQVVEIEKEIFLIENPHMEIVDSIDKQVKALVEARVDTQVDKQVEVEGGLKAAEEIEIEEGGVPAEDEIEALVDAQAEAQRVFRVTDKKEIPVEGEADADVSKALKAEEMDKAPDDFLEPDAEIEFVVEPEVEPEVVEAVAVAIEPEGEPESEIVAESEVVEAEVVVEPGVVEAEVEVVAEVEEKDKEKDQKKGEKKDEE